jgi:hypothetical protein
MTGRAMAPDIINGIKDKRIRFNPFRRNLWSLGCAERCYSQIDRKIHIGSQFGRLVSSRQAAPASGLPERTSRRWLPYSVIRIRRRCDGLSIPAESTFYGNIFKVQYHSREEEMRRFLLAGNCLCHPTVMIRRQCHDEVATTSGSRRCTIWIFDSRAEASDLAIVPETLHAVQDRQRRR